MKKKTSKARVQFLRSIASVGGKNGTGASKRRSPEHYRKIMESRKLVMTQAMVASVRARWEKRKEKTPPLTLAKLAKECKVSVSYISLIVNNKRKP